MDNRLLAEQYAETAIDVGWSNAVVFYFFALGMMFGSWISFVIYTLINF